MRKINNIYFKSDIKRSSKDDYHSTVRVKLDWSLARNTCGKRFIQICDLHNPDHNPDYP